ncbi:MAG: type IX secretion system membrane protein PorP/SprF [Dysgonomonas sp.]
MHAFASPRLYAQWDPQISQYWTIKSYYNPSFAGENSDLQATAIYRQQWVGVKHAPKTFIATAGMPLKFLGRVHGVGANVMTESIGLFSNTSVGAQYVYKKHWKKWKNNNLNVGVQIGFSRIGFDANGIYLPDDVGKDDEVIPTNTEQASVFDAGLGVSFTTPKYYVGFSASHLTEPTFELGENSKSYIVRTYYLTGGYNITFRNPLYELQPSFLIKSDAVVTQYDVTLRMVYNKMFNGGVSWRKDDGFVFLLGFRYKGFDAGYAYDLSTSAISKASSGTHEIFFEIHNADQTFQNR